MIWLNGVVSRLAGLLGGEQGNWADRGVVVAIFTRVLTVITERHVSHAVMPRLSDVLAC